MKFGIFGSEHDAQCQALRAILEKKGAKVVIVESQGLNLSVDTAFDGERFFYNGQDLSDVQCWYLRYIMSPLPPAFEAGDDYYLFSDWFKEYMHRRERFSFQLSWLLSLGFQGIPVVNPPEHGSVAQLKTFQLHAARKAGLAIPKTLITNNPSRVRQFARETPSAIYKPAMGGSFCRHLDAEALSRIDLITASPVIFQEKIEGRSIRLTIIGDELVSAVAIPSDSMDYRSDPAYSGGRQTYEPVEIPASILGSCLTLMRSCGLCFTGIDLIQKPDGSFVFLEANSSPIYLDIEQKTKTPITAKLADYLFHLSHAPKKLQKTDSFLSYANPFNPSQSI